MTAEHIPISIFTGFLGSGKTTLINKLLPAPEMANTAVLVNEFGQIGIDNDLIEKSDDAMVQLSNGCVCCSLNDELAETLMDLADQRRTGALPKFERVLIETTGLANAGPITRIILEDPRVREVYALDSVVTTVDAVNGTTNLNIHAESVEQVAVADRLVLTKLDLLSSEEAQEGAAELRGRLSALNPGARIVSADAASVLKQEPDEDSLYNADPARWRRLEEPMHTHGEHAAQHDHDHDHDHDHPIGSGVARHDDHIGSFCLVRDEPLTLQSLERFWQALAEEAGPNLLRVKGFVNVLERPGRPALLQGVQQIFDAMRWLDTWPSDDHRTRIVFIGWMLDQDRIERLLTAAEA